MFEKDLEARLLKIFGVKRVRLDAPGESREQDTLFIEIQDVIPRVGSGRQTARVSGELVMFSQRDKLPYGFFAKRIEKADWSLTRPLFFGSESNAEVFQNLIERRMPFTFLYKAQYDPNQGQMTELQFGECV